MSYPTPDPSASPDDLQLRLDKRHIDAARAAYRENKGAERAVFFAIGQQVGRDNVELRDNLVQVFVECGVPTATVSGMFNISGREVWDIVSTDPIALFECLECNKPLAMRGLNDRKRLQRARDAVRNAAPGSRGSAVLFCEVCTEAVLGRLNEQGRRGRLALDARIYELNKMSYEEYLQTSEWRATRIAALGWAKHRCQLCNSGDEELHVHHRVYTQRGCERLEDLIVLCSTHHRQFHGVEHDAS